MKKKLYKLLFWVVLLLCMLAFIGSAHFPIKYIIIFMVIGLLWVGAIFYFAYKSIKPDLKIAKKLRYKCKENAEKTAEILTRGISTEDAACTFFAEDGALNGSMVFSEPDAETSEVQQERYQTIIMEQKKGGAIVEITVPFDDPGELCVTAVDDFMSVSMGAVRVP